MSFILFLGTYTTSMALKKFKTSRYFPTMVSTWALNNFHLIYTVSTMIQFYVRKRAPVIQPFQCNFVYLKNCFPDFSICICIFKIIIVQLWKTFHGFCSNNSVINSDCHNSDCTKMKKWSMLYIKIHKLKKISFKCIVFEYGRKNSFHINQEFWCRISCSSDVQLSILVVKLWAVGENFNCVVTQVLA